MTLSVVGYSDLEGVYDDPDRLARLATTLREYDGLVVGAGDNTALGVAATVSVHREVELPTPAGRKLAAPFARAVDPDAETFGNHDLDHGPADGRDLATLLPAGWTCGNLADATGRFGREAGVETTRVVETDAGRVGIFGVTTPDLPDLCPAASDLTVTDPVATARDDSRELREVADYVVGLSHCGSRDPAVARAADADLVLGGHRHERHAGTYDGTLLVRTGGTGVVEATTDGSYTFRDEFDSEPHPGVRDTYQRVRDALGLDESLATVGEPLVRDRATLRAGETRIGNFVADAYRTRTGVDVGLMHDGSLRTGAPLDGTVTAADVLSVSPFGNRLTTVSLSGSELRRCIAGHCPTPDREAFRLSISGGSVVWDDTATELREVRVAGEPLDSDDTYTVALQEYFVVSRSLAVPTEADVTGYHGLQYDHLLAHARDGGLDVQTEGRIERVGERN